MENLVPQDNTLSQQVNSQQVLTFDLDVEIRQQQPLWDEIALFLQAKWVQIRVGLLQQSPDWIPTGEFAKEELRQIRRMVEKFNGHTPRDFVCGIRWAADAKLEFHKGDFPPRLFYTDIDQGCMDFMADKIKNKKPEVLELPQNTGGNDFFGEPSEALAREWPKIVQYTMNMRENFGEDWRYRFWATGSKEQRASAVQMLHEMVSKLKDWPKWNPIAAQAYEKQVFQREYWTVFPDWRYVVDGLSTIRDEDQMQNIRNTTRSKIKSATLSGKQVVPKFEDFPDLQDCSYCTIFDHYLEYWQELQSFSEAEILE